MRTTAILVVSACLAALPATAQVSDAFICDDKSDQIYRLVDLDGDGLYATQGEAVVFVDQNGLDVDLNVADFYDGPGNPIIYWNNTKTQDGIYRGEDLNGNGVIDSSEIVQFYDSLGSGEDIDSEGLAVAADGAVWWASDYSGAQGIWRARDLNSDGDAMDPGETVRLVDAGSQGSNPQITVETDSGPALIHTADFWRMAPDGNGVIVYEGFLSSCLTSEDAIFRFEDKNNDGDVTDAGESRLFLNYHDKDAPTNDLPANPDFLSGGPLRSWTLNTFGSGSCPGANYGRMNVVSSRQEGPVTAYYLSTDVSSTSFTFNTNINGLGINGLIYRGVDLNLDNDINDAGEVKLFYDGSYTGPFAASNREIDKNVGMHAGPDGLYVSRLINSGSVCRFVDLNGDGDAMDQQVDIGGGVLVDEMTMDVFDYTTFWLNLPPFPVCPTLPCGVGMYNGPFLKDLAIDAPGRWATPLPPAPGFVTSGNGCAPWGNVPVISGTGVPQIGTSNFSAVVSNVPGGVPAALLVGDNTTTWFGVPLPFDLGGIGLFGCTLYQNSLYTFSANTTGTPSLLATDGVGSFALAIPNNPNFVGFLASLQWVVINTFDAPLPTIGLTGLGQVTVLQ